MKKQFGSWKKAVLTAAVMVFVFLLVQEAGADPKAYTYILPQADSRYYTAEDFSEMPLQVVCYAKNEIYARHGRQFQSQELQGYFKEQEWYRGTVAAADFSESVFNEYESANAALLSETEKKLQAGGYVLDQAGYSYEAVYDFIRTSDLTNTASAELTPDEVGGISSGLICNNHTQIFFTDFFIFDIPDSWMTGFTYLYSESNIEFYCNAVRNAPGLEDGFLCEIFRCTDSKSSSDMEGLTSLGYAGGYYYYLREPTDFRANPKDAENCQIYREMFADVSKVVSSMNVYQK